MRGPAYAPAAPPVQRRAVTGVCPAHPRDAGTSVVAYVRELVARHGFALSAAAEGAWQAFGGTLLGVSSVSQPPPARRSLLLEPHAQDRIPAEFDQLHVDVALRGVDGRSHLYRMGDVTGVDERVQARVASQEVTAECLLTALLMVETQDLHKFSFVCHSATHRSVACCFLLAALAYPNAMVHLTTARTRRAATGTPMASAAGVAATAWLRTRRTQRTRR